MTPDQQAEYARHRAFVLALAEAMDEMARQGPPTETVGVRGPDGVFRERQVPRGEPRFVADITEILETEERRSPARAATSLRSLLPDLLEMTRHMEADWVRQLDGQLAVAGLPTLSQVRNETWKTIPKTMARGRIRTRAEYDLLIERLNDVDDPSLSDADRSLVGRMVADYEDRHGS